MEENIKKEFKMVWQAIHNINEQIKKMRKAKKLPIRGKNIVDFGLPKMPRWGGRYE